jgi:enoyl-CoA hydratase/carnithine racemase
MAIDVTVHDHWAELRLTGATAWSDIRAQLEALSGAGDARVVLVVVAGGATVDAWDPEGTLWLSRHYTTPVVAALAGPVDGSMARLALAADIRIGAQSLRLDMRGMGRGQISARAATLLAGLPDRRATARNLTADEALAFGLISRLVPESQLAEARRDIAMAIAARGPIATKLAKEAVWRGLDMPLEQALRFETDLTLLLQTTKDRAEGVAAFVEKRNPHFTGE